MCSLTEAFQSFVDPVPRSDNLLGEFVEDQSGFDSNEKKKRKKRRAPMPPQEQVIEPDRPAHRQLPGAELLGGQDKSMFQSEMLNAAEPSTAHFPNPSIDVSNKNVYMLEPDWATSFNETSTPSWIKDRMPRREAEAPLIASPWLDGSPTLWKKTHEEQPIQAEIEKVEEKANDALDSLQQKFDIMFKKLEDLETARSESQHIEIILFVLGGIFIILLLDLMVRQGTQAMMLMNNVNANVNMNQLGGFIF
jgi:hypothetical protein